MSGFGTVTIDPPWDHGITQRLGGKGRRTTAHGGYPRMTVEEIAAQPVDTLAAPSAHLYLWTTAGALLRGFPRLLLDTWRFEPVTILVWHKKGRIGLGTYYRNSTEFCVFARRGFGTVPECPWPSTWFEAPRGRHSVKPDIFYDAVEQVSPGPYLEMFARTPRLGWAHHGDGFRVEEATA